MNLKTLTFYRHLFFLLLSSLGFFYLAFLLFFTPKVYSGFLMQLIFLIDSLVVHPQNVFALIFQFGFLLQLIAGFLWTYLLVRFVKAVVKIINQVKLTHQFVQSLRISRITKQYYVFESTDPQVFTVGFTEPQIYISQKLLDISNPSELSSILHHEQSHVSNHDPLKNLLIDFIKNTTPPFPLKTWLFGQYLTLIEISCDQFSKDRFSHPTSLVSALLKIQQFNTPVFVSGFSAQSERIKILVGQKKQPFRSLVFTNVAVIALLFVVSGSLYHTNLFYECDHLLKCFENLITPDHTITETSAISHHCLNQ